MSEKEIVVPDIGDFSEVEIIEVCVSEGETVEEEASLITLETDKAAMDIPAPEAGVVKQLKVAVGDKVSEGSVILTMEVAGAASAEAPSPAPVAESAPEPAASAPQVPASAPTEVEKAIHLPDIGSEDAVEVIEVSIAPGDDVEEDAAMITLESEKASMEVPVPHGGSVLAVHVSVGDKVKTGDLVATMKVMEGGTPVAPATNSAPATSSAPAKSAAPKPAPVQDVVLPVASGKSVYAGPSSRRFARELGVDLSQVKGSGRKGRILKQDIKQFVKVQLTQGGGASASPFPPMPEIDFTRFGEIEVKPLSRIKKLTATNLHRNWVTIPHVTQFDEADITDLEAFRKAQKEAAAQAGVRMTLLVFIIKAVVSALEAFPQFNASLAPNGEELIFKKYFHVGVAVDTPGGLVVPVILDADKKGLYQLANEIGELSQTARDQKLTAKQMQGACFTISSLGGIGGTAFTPIVNAPDVAILGVSRAQMKPIYQGDSFVPRLMMPLSLSYDHRVIDGAEAARFITHLSQRLSDIRRLLL